MISGMSQAPAISILAIICGRSGREKKMDNGIYVMMAVKVVGLPCKDCGDLEVENLQSRRYKGDQLTGFDNRLECAHLTACLKMKENKEE